MTKDEAPQSFAKDETKSRLILGQFLIFFGVSLFVGAIAAFITITLDRGLNIIAVVVCGILVAIGLLMAVVAVRIGDFEPPTLKTRAGRSQLILLICLFLGALLGVYFNLTDAIDRIFEGTLVLSRTEAIVALVLLLGLILPIGLYWQKQIDEHERAAAKDSGYIALNLYFYGYLAWVIAASAKILPAVDHFILFIIVLFTFLIAWTAKRAG